MLLVDDYEAEIFELDAFLDEGVRSYYELSIALRNVAADGTFTVLFERAG
jgi:hypothetical protein